jgi:hypothetical protein
MMNPKKKVVEILRDTSLKCYSSIFLVVVGKD